MRRLLVACILVTVASLAGCVTPCYDGIGGEGTCGTPFAPGSSGGGGGGGAGAR